jgi:membrane-bound serine protease (ClpP class)
MITTVVALAAAGVLLLFLEMFLPGIIAGVIGGILLIAAVVTAYRDIGPEAGNITLLATVAMTGALWWWWATRFQHTRFGRRMTLSISSVGTSAPEGLDKLTGQIGTAATPLRPSGTILVDGRRVDAMTGGEFLESGTPVLVVRTDGPAVLVRRRP